jgi:hypothetical protein
MMSQKHSESLWREIRHEYQTSKTTCRELALKYGINRETVSSRCKLEKWRYGRREQKTQQRESPSQLGARAVLVPSQQNFSERVLREANQWLDRIDEAYEGELRYDRIEAIQKLLPQWKNAVESVKKGLEVTAEPATKPILIDWQLLISNAPLPPLIDSRPALSDLPG